MRVLLLAAVVAATASIAPVAGAQGSDQSIDPGMSKKQVIEHLGQPATTRTYNGKTYMLYTNKCKSCGMQDVVILENDAVVDAVFRDPNRHYTGNSSSPEALTASQAKTKVGPLTVSEPAANPAPKSAPAAPTQAEKVTPAPPPPPAPPTASAPAPLPPPAAAPPAPAPAPPAPPAPAGMPAATDSSGDRPPQGA
ncbi:MAG TPA: outer membrane protein assembly factor BamE [Gemmatimonadaceae bacterium]|nr:outer membrane protein assembly factor BamE [Gemmatimonadaceae bacterium]